MEPQKSKNKITWLVCTSDTRTFRLVREATQSIDDRQGIDKTSLVLGSEDADSVGFNGGLDGYPLHIL